MMASTFSAGAALLLAASMTPQATPSEPVDDHLIRQVRAAAAETAHADAQAYLEQERRSGRIMFASASMDRPRSPRDTRFDPFSRR